VLAETTFPVAAPNQRLEEEAAANTAETEEVMFATSVEMFALVKEMFDPVAETKFKVLPFAFTKVRLAVEAVFAIKFEMVVEAS
jgi:hypothetical protein